VEIYQSKNIEAYNKLTEAQVKQACEEYLGYAQNQGKLWYCRLNAGDIFIPNKDGSMRVFKGAGAGTADLIVIQPGQVHLEYMEKQQGPGIPVAFTTFIECKSSKGKTTKVQDEFAERIRKLHCRYCVVRSVDELQEVLKRE